MTVEERLAEWEKQPGARVSSDERAFILYMREASKRGVGYGWMQQVIEWEWQSKDPKGAWGPEYFAAQRAEAVASNAEWLSTLQCSSFHLTRDDEHAPNYATAKEWIEEYQPKDFTDVDPVELQAMKDTNTIWCLQIYPNTPVGFNIWYGATMDSVIAQARRDYMNPVR